MNNVFLNEKQSSFVFQIYVEYCYERNLVSLFLSRFSGLSVNTHTGVPEQIYWSFDECLTEGFALQAGTLKTAHVTASM